MKTTPKISAAEFLKKKRNSSGFTQGEVAKLMGYTSAQFISNWERGMSNPPMRALKTLSKLLKFQAEELIEIIALEVYIERKEKMINDLYKVN